jgi:hypothetical protein
MADLPVEGELPPEVADDHDHVATGVIVKAHKPA